MSLIPFWAFNLSDTLLSMQGQKALGFHQNILICVQKMNEDFTGLEQHEGATTFATTIAVQVSGLKVVHL